MVTITIYRITGKHGPFFVSNNLCKECDLALATAHKIARDIGIKKVKVKAKSYFEHFFEVIIKGGWHAPVVLVNGKICSQGKVPDYNILKAKVTKLLQ